MRSQMEETTVKGSVMKTAFVAAMMVTSSAIAQEEGYSEWSIMPSISVSRVFSVGNRYDNYYRVQPLIHPPVSGRTVGYAETNRLSATGVSFSARFLDKDFEPFAFTLSAGANWYDGRDDEMMSSPFLRVAGIPNPIDSLRLPMPDYRDFRGGFYEREVGGFMSFPVSIGAQVVFPYEKIDKLMFFAGVEGNFHFLSERVFARRQVEAGFSAVGGVAIKMFEFGVRYSRFAGTNNLGVQGGIRFNTFSL